MSLILDALKKADRERSQSQDAPSLDSTHKVPEAHTKGIVINSKVVAIGVGTLATVVLVAYFAGKSTSTPESTQAEKNLPSAEQQSSKQKIKTIPKVSSRYSDFQEKLQDKKIAAEYERAQTGEQRPKDQPVKAVPPKPVEAPATKAVVQSEPEPQNLDVSSIYSEGASSSNQAKGQDSLSSTSSNQPPAEGNTLADYAHLGTIRDLPWTLQDTIPSLTYSAHNYSQYNATVTINKKTYRKGSKLANNLFIEKILEDGIILKYNNERFKMRALSSWVNM